MDPGMTSASDVPPQSAPPAEDRDRRDRDHDHAPESSNGDSRPSGHGYREKPVKPNKIYIGGLPEHTRREDLQSCFGKIGTIADIELKIGFGFVEFESQEAAEESVAKYHEGYFMGNKIKVEISHGGGRFSKFNAEPGACFKCGQMGHWARECPNSSGHSETHRTPGEHVPRKGPTREYREGGSNYRETHPKHYMPRDARYGGSGYDYASSRRPASPPRDYRDYPNPPRRDADDSRIRGPPPPPPPAAGYDSRPGYYAPPPVDDRAGYVPRGYPPAPPSRDYDRYDRRAPPPNDRYPYPPGGGGRPRSPAGVPPDGTRGRDDFNRPPRDFSQAPANDYRGRPASPPRYADYPPRNAGSGFRRRSQSPPARGGPGGYYAYPPGAPPYAGAPPPVPQNGGPVRDYPPRGEPGYRRP
ncbi:hypothetical protein K488DRAFT_85970 [Vararia minispora EC-137]|uniref:Uncharacterized protein n=1 Tax=Vararia minispora EC-137 TaxID=1314806 RepID=A0ACB8QLP8_9AGAM|nr:hypothetical protein K488DRAFT_85970 [Vararia minispora EC-137]